MKIIKHLISSVFLLLFIFTSNSISQPQGNMKDRFYTGVFNFYYLAYPHIYSSGPDRYKQLGFNMLQCYGHHEG